MRALVYITFFTLFVNTITLCRPILEKIESTHIKSFDFVKREPLSIGSSLEFVWKIYIDPSSKLKVFYCGHNKGNGVVFPLGFTTTGRDFQLALADNELFSKEIQKEFNNIFEGNVETHKNDDNNGYYLKLKQLKKEHDRMTISCILKYEMDSKKEEIVEIGGDYIINIQSTSKLQMVRTGKIVLAAVMFDIVFIGIGIATAVQVQRKQKKKYSKEPLVPNKGIENGFQKTGKKQVQNKTQNKKDMIETNVKTKSSIKSRPPNPNGSKPLTSETRPIRPPNPNGSKPLKAETKPIRPPNPNGSKPLTAELKPIRPPNPNGSKSITAETKPIRPPNPNGSKRLTAQAKPIRPSDPISTLPLIEKDLFEHENIKPTTSSKIENQHSNLHLVMRCNTPSNDSEI